MREVKYIYLKKEHKPGNFVFTKIGDRLYYRKLDIIDWSLGKVPEYLFQPWPKENEQPGFSFAENYWHVCN
jgi:hypothetical protein